MRIDEIKNVTLAIVQADHSTTKIGNVDAVIWQEKCLFCEVLTPELMDHIPDEGNPFKPNKQNAKLWRINNTKSYMKISC